MANITLPYTFVAGTKAKASEVNANFTTLKSAILTKADKNGDNTQTFSIATGIEDNHAITKAQLETTKTELFTTAKTNLFCINSPADTTASGTTALSYNGSNIIINANIATNILGESFTQTDAIIDVSSYVNGSYNVFEGKNKIPYTLKNGVYKQPAEPQSPNVNTVWLKMVEPIEVYIFNGSEWESFSDVHLGRVVVKNTIVTDCFPLAYGENGFNLVSPALTPAFMQTKGMRTIVDALPASKSESYSNEWYRVWSDGWIEQGGYVSPNAAHPTINFPKAFAATPKFISCSQFVNSAYDANITISARTTTYFRIFQSQTVNFYWYACGF